MALVLDATPGGVSANSYATVAEADTYHESRLYVTDWTGATTPDKTAALVMATRLLDQMYEWAEWSSSTTQALQWPRNGMLDFLELSNIPSTDIPVQLKNATSEFARQLLVGDRSADDDVETKGIKSLSAGPVSLTFTGTALPKVIPDAVFNMIPSHWGTVKSRKAGSRELQRQ